MKLTFLFECSRKSCNSVFNDFVIPRATTIELQLRWVALPHPLPKKTVYTYAHQGVVLGGGNWGRWRKPGNNKWKTYREWASQAQVGSTAKKKSVCPHMYDHLWRGHNHWNIFTGLCTAFGTRAMLGTRGTLSINVRIIAGWAKTGRKFWYRMFRIEEISTKLGARRTRGYKVTIALLLRTPHRFYFGHIWSTEQATTLEFANVEPSLVIDNEICRKLQFTIFYHLELS